MKSLRDACTGTACMVLLVVGGFWYARDPGLKSLPLSLIGASASRPSVLSSVFQIDWSEDGSRLLSLSRGDVGLDGPLLLHDLNGGRCAIELEDLLPSCAALSPDGLHALVGTWKGELFWINLESMQAERLLQVPDYVGITTAVISADGVLALAAVSDGRIFVFRPQADLAPLVLEGGRASVCSLQCSSDSGKLVSANGDGTVDVWDLVRGERLLRIQGHTGLATAAAFLDGDSKVISAGMDDTVRIWDLADGHEVWRGHFECNGITALALAPDGKTAAWGGFNRRIIVWDLERSHKNFEIPIPASAVLHVKFSPDGKRLAAAGMESTIRLYDSGTGIESRLIETGMNL